MNEYLINNCCLGTVIDSLYIYHVCVTGDFCNIRLKRSTMIYVNSMFLSSKYSAVSVFIASTKEQFFNPIICAGVSRKLVD